MAVIRDVMPAFELFQPASTDDAVSLLSQYGGDAWVMAGGLDSFDWLKDRIKRPKVVVDLSQMQEMRGVRETGDGVEIGAMTTLTEVVRNPIMHQQIQNPYAGRGSGRLAANSQPGHDRRQYFAGHALLVLPQRFPVLPRWRQHLLRGYAERHQSRARHSGSGPLRRRKPVGFRSGDGRA